MPVTVYHVIQGTLVTRDGGGGVYTGAWKKPRVWWGGGGSGGTRVSQPVFGVYPVLFQHFSKQKGEYEERSRSSAWRRLTTPSHVIQTFAV